MLFVPFGGAGVCFYRLTSYILPCLARPQASRRYVRVDMQLVTSSNFQRAESAFARRALLEGNAWLRQKDRIAELNPDLLERSTKDAK